MKPEFFKKLTEEEERECRQWARDNYTLGDPIPQIHHPAVQAECALMNLERNREAGVEEPQT